MISDLPTKDQYDKVQQERDLLKGALETEKFKNYQLRQTIGSLDGQLRRARHEARTGDLALRWEVAALSCGLYRADTDVSTPEKWKSAQLAAAVDLLSQVKESELSQPLRPNPYV